MVNELIYGAINTEPGAAELTKKEKEEVLKQTRNLPFRFLRDSFGKAGKKALTALVYLAQKASFFMLNLLYESQSKKQSDFHATLLGDLTRFIEYLRKDFHAYFDHESPMPFALWAPVNEKIEAALNPGEAFLLNDVDTHLVEALKQQYAELTNPYPLNFIAASYWTGLLGVLCDTPAGGDATLRAIYNLVSYNFNSSHFIKYVLHRYAAALPAEGEPSVHWANNLQHVNRISEVPGIALFRKQPACKKMLIDAINTEIYACEFTETGTKLLEPVPCFHTNLSVSQLGVFYRLMVDEQMIKTDNNRALMKYVAQTHRNNRSDSLSEKHLYDKFYNMEPAAMSIMQTYLVNMLNRLKRY